MRPTRVLSIGIACTLGSCILAQEARCEFPPTHRYTPYLSAAETTYSYVPVPGKTLGMWPDVWTVERMSLFRTRYGFSGVFIHADSQQYANAIQAGFSSAQITIGISIGTYTYAADNLPAGTYYLDEPVEHDCYGHPTAGYLYTTQELATVRDYIHSHQPGALFVIGGYKRCSHNQIAATYADLMMYSSYKNWDDFGLPVCHVNIGWGNDWESPWIPGDSDQRNSWSSMRQVFGAKYSRTWIHGGGDEYDLLFPHANTIGLTGIWQYNGGPIDSARLEAFCYAAWQNGWLERIPNDPLPIQLAWFTGISIAPNVVRLQWLTLSELNNYGFEVQRQPPGEIGFETLPNSFVPGNGTTLDPHEYSFIDSPALGDEWVYRLKQIDLDGTLHYSEPIHVHMITAVNNELVPVEFSVLQNYPNPFNPSTTIVFSVPHTGPVKLSVFNLVGEELVVLVVQELTPGTYSVKWDAGEHSSGVYLARLRTADGSTARKLLLVR